MVRVHYYSLWWQASSLSWKIGPLSKSLCLSLLERWPCWWMVSNLNPNQIGFSLCITVQSSCSSYSTLISPMRPRWIQMKTVCHPCLFDIARWQLPNNGWRQEGGSYYNQRSKATVRNALPKIKRYTLAFICLLSWLKSCTTLCLVDSTIQLSMCYLFSS